MDAPRSAPVLLPADGAPVAVAVPGLGLTVDGWRGVVEQLGAALPTAVVALPSFGLRAPRGAPLDPATLADDLAGRLADHGLLANGALVVAGHSASCQVVAELARRHPHTVRGLLLIGPTTDPRASPLPPLVAGWLRTAVQEDPRRIPSMLRQYATTRLSGFARTILTARYHDLRDALAASAVPVLVVRGRRDRIAPARWLADLARTRPGIRTVTAADGAHMLPLTRPADVARWVGEVVDLAATPATVWAPRPAG